MDRFPDEFSDLLTPRGLRVLAGREPGASGALSAPTSRFVALTGVVQPRKAARLRQLLERALGPHLLSMEDPIPPESLLGMTENYGELLPKTVRVRTAMLEHRRARAWRVAEELGLVRMMQSESLGRFAAAVSGRTLRKRWGIQALRYGPGDYAGPHNDHHPEDLEARDGYVDVHLTLASPAVEHQWLVYARGGHLSEMASVATEGGMTVYRLPFWHYTTPLVARAGRERDAHRWVLLGTFLYAKPGARPGSVLAPPA